MARPRSKFNFSGCGCLLLLLAATACAAFGGTLFWLNRSRSPENISSYAPSISSHSTYVPEKTVSISSNPSYPVRPLDIAGQVSDAAPAASDAAYTVFMVLNGSDLETQNGFATGDLMEILSSGLDSGRVNFLILAGGTLEWQNDFMPDREYAVYRVIDGALETLCLLGRQDLADPALLAGFLELGYSLYPARQYGLIFWDHGGGAVIGCGYDEITEHSLRLHQLEAALASSRAAESPLEFIGFDACIMANLETACICSRYANYLIASEELEPGSGWDYGFLSRLSQDGPQTGAEIGRRIGEDYISYYNTLAGQLLGVRAAISVTDLRRIPAVTQAVEDLAEAVNQRLVSGGYNRIARLRGRTMGFAGTGDEDDYDLVDLAALCEQLGEDYPLQAGAVVSALEEAVVFCDSTQTVENANGLTVYFPFFAKLSSYEYIPLYEELDVLPRYTEMIVNFARILNGDSVAVGSGFDAFPITPEQGTEGTYFFRLTPEELDRLYGVRFTLWQVLERREDGLICCIQREQTRQGEIGGDGTILTRFDGLQTTLDGRPCCLYETDNSPQGTRYYIPAVLNGQNVRLMVQAEEGDGTVIGASPEREPGHAPAPQRGLTAIKPGDRLRLRYPAALFSIDGGDIPGETDFPEQYEGEEWMITRTLKVKRTAADEGEYLYGFVLVDTQRREHATDFIRVMLSHEKSAQS